jgi:hypothetical protein
MDSSEQSRFDDLYLRHLRMLKLQGKSSKTIDVYARAVRRVTNHFDCCPDLLTPDQLEIYFGQLVDSHSWSTVKVDRNGLQFFWKHVLKLDWQWVNIIKPPKIQTIPDILTLAEVNQAGLKIPVGAPKKWVVNCQHVGAGLPALKYLSRYLYRGVIAEKNILSCRDGEVTFSYIDSDTGQKGTRTLKGEDFLWLVLQHVLPRGFRRVRDYGFLHGNAKRLLFLVQLILRVMLEPNPPRPRPVFKCPHCKANMVITAFRRPAWLSG